MTKIIEHMILSRSPSKLTNHRHHLCGVQILQARPQIASKCCWEKTNKSTQMYLEDWLHFTLHVAADSAFLSYQPGLSTQFWESILLPWRHQRFGKNARCCHTMLSTMFSFLAKKYSNLREKQFLLTNFITLKQESDKGKPLSFV